MPPGPAATSGGPKRFTAVGGAVAVTVLTLGGALGFGPGAAMGQPPTASNLQPSAASVTDDPTTSGTDERAPSSALTEGDSADDRPVRGGEADTLGTGLATPAAEEVPPRSGHGKRIIYDISAQRVWLVTRKDRVARTYSVSGSRDEDLLDPGRYAVYSKSRNATSFNAEETMNYMVRFATGDRFPIGFHDIPAFPDGTLAQTRSELGTPQSAGCIRQWITDARALWEFAPLKTPVVVTA